MKIQALFAIMILLFSVCASKAFAHATPSIEAAAAADGFAAAAVLATGSNAFCTDRTDCADRAYRTDCADCAVRADRADRTDVVFPALTPDSNTVKSARSSMPPFVVSLPPVRGELASRSW